MTRIELLLRRAARLFPNQAAIDDRTRRVSWSQLQGEADTIASGLAGLGVGPGDRVVVVGSNQIAYAALYFACARLSAVLVPLNTRLLPSEQRALIERSGARVVIADPRPAAALSPLPAEIVGLLLGSCDDPVEGFRPLGALPPATDGLPRPGGADQIAVQMYTSGTTGTPKGAMLTHANVTAMTASWLLELHLRSPDDTFLQVTPLYHVGAMLMLMSCAASGAHMLLLPEFTPAGVARALSSEGVTHTLLVPAMIRWLLDDPASEGLDFPQLRTVVYGASPIPVPQLQRAMARFGCALLQGYGLTETAGVLTTLRPADHLHDPADPPAHLASAGRPVLGVLLRLVDEQGVDVPPGGIGEIVAQGPNVFVGYHEMPEATEAAFLVDEAGGRWFRTGDLATEDVHGFVRIVDRSKDMILVGGVNVYPREIEDVLRTHALVSDVAVLGIPHETWGEAVLAVIVATHPIDDPDAATRQLVRHARAHLARFKCPSTITFAPELPRNAAGKVLKARLRAPYWADHDRQV